MPPIAGPRLHSSTHCWSTRGDWTALRDFCKQCTSGLQWHCPSVPINLVLASKLPCHNLAWAIGNTIPALFMKLQRCHLFLDEKGNICSWSDRVEVDASTLLIPRSILPPHWCMVATDLWCYGGRHQSIAHWELGGSRCRFAGENGKKTKTAFLLRCRTSIQSSHVDEVVRQWGQIAFCLVNRAVGEILL